MLLFAFYALCHFGSLLLPNIIAVKSLMLIHIVAAHWVFLRMIFRPNVRKEVFPKVFVSRCIIPLCLDCKYLEDGGLALNNPVSLSQFLHSSFF